MPLLVALAAALMLGVLEGPGGFYLGGVLGLGGALIWQQRRELRQLRARIDALLPLAAPPASAPAPADAAAAPVDGRAAQGIVDEPAPARTTTAGEIGTSPGSRDLPRPAAAVAAAAAPAADSESGRLGRAALAALLGFFTTGNLVVRIGVVVLFIGVAFLLRYAYDHALLPIELRLAGTAVGGIALTALGWRLRGRTDTYGLVLQGAGVGLLYLCVFAAARLFDLVPMAAAFGALVVLVAASSLLAVVQNSQALAVFAMSGGFLAPVLLSTGSGSHVALFSYYAVLNAGILAMAWFRFWRWLNWIGFVFTFVISATWGLQYYRPELFATTQPFLLLFFGYYLGVSVLFARRQSPDLKGLIDGTLVFGTPLAALGLQWGLVRDLPFGMAYSALGAAVIYLSLAAWLKRQGAFSHLLAQSFLALAVVFATLAVPFAVSDQRWTAATWALEGAGLLWVGLRQRQMLPRLFGIGLQLAAGVAYVSRWPFDGATPPLANGEFLAAALLGMAAGFSAWLLTRLDPAEPGNERLRRGERLLRWPLLYLGVAWWVFAGLLEIGRYRPAASDPFVPDNLHEHLVVLFAAASTALLTDIARRLSWREALAPGLLLLPGLILCLVTLDLGWREALPLADLGWLAWPAGFAALYWHLARRDAQLPPASRGVSGVWHAAVSWFLVIIAAWLLAASAVRWLEGSAWATAAWGAVPLIWTFVHLRLARDAPRWPHRRHPDSYFGWGQGVLLAGLLWWLVAAGLQPSDPAPLPYVPLLHPVELTQIGVLLALAVAASARQGPWKTVGLTAAGLAAFLWLNLSAARAVHFYGGVAYPVDRIVVTDTFQTTASILWTVAALALMGIGSRAGRRAGWITGACLLALVIVKLFTIDLSRLALPARIVSFMGVGVLMLIIGYLAPLPPARRAAAASAEAGAAADAAADAVEQP